MLEFLLVPGEMGVKDERVLRCEQGAGTAWLSWYENDIAVASERYLEGSPKQNDGIVKQYTW